MAVAKTNLTNVTNVAKLHASNIIVVNFYKDDEFEANLNELQEILHRKKGKHHAGRGKKYIMSILSQKDYRKSSVSFNKSLISPPMHCFFLKD